MSMVDIYHATYQSIAFLEMRISLNLIFLNSLAMQHCFVVCVQDVVLSVGDCCLTDWWIDCLIDCIGNGDAVILLLLLLEVSKQCFATGYSF